MPACASGCVSLPSRIAELWREALHHAGIDNSSVSIHFIPGPLLDGSIACLVPGFQTVGELVPPKAGEVLDSEALCRVERLLIHLEELPEELVGALFRHELQHTLQIRARPELHPLALLAAGVVSYAEGELGGRGYNLIPSERDANATAHDFVVGLLGAGTVAVVEAANPGHASLRPGNRPHKSEDLPGLLVAFLANRISLCRRYVADSDFADDPRGLDRAFASILDLESSGAGGEWLCCGRIAWEHSVD